MPSLQTVWKHLQSEQERSLFLLATFFPAGTAVPLWQLELAAGQNVTSSSLKQACLHLQSVGLFKEVTDEQVRLSVAQCQFGQKFIQKAGIEGKKLLAEASQHLLYSCWTIDELQQRVDQMGYDVCKEQMQSIGRYLNLLGYGEYKELVKKVEYWLSLESPFLTTISQLSQWSDLLPDFFCQQLYNRSVEAEALLSMHQEPVRWLRLTEKAGIEDPSFLYMLSKLRQSKINVPSRDERLALRDQMYNTISPVRGTLQLGPELTDWVNSVAFSSYGRLILTGSEDGMARLWRARTQNARPLKASHRRKHRSLPDQTDRIYRRVILFPNGREVLKGLPGRQEVLKSLPDQWFRFWETDSTHEIRQFDGSHGVDSVAFSLDEQKILTGSSDEKVRLWDVENGQQCLWEGDLPGVVEDMALSLDGRLALTSSQKYVVRLWEVSSRRELLRLEGHTSQIESMAFSPDGYLMLTASSESARIWEVSSGQLVWEVSTRKRRLWQRGEDERVTYAAFSLDGRFVLIGKGKTAHMWEVSSGLLYELHCHRNNLRSIAFSPEGQLVLAGAADDTARLWDVSSGKEQRRLEGYTGWIKSVAFSLDGRFMLTVSSEHLKVWEVSSGRLLWEVNYQSRAELFQAMFSPDGQLVIAGYDGAIRFLMAESGQKLLMLPCTGIVKGVSFSPDGHIAAVYTRDGWVYFCRVQEPDRGKPLGIYVAAHEVGAVCWRQSNSLVIADKGGPTGRPHFYHLTLEGKWE